MDRTEDFILSGGKVSNFWLHLDGTICEKYLAVSLNKGGEMEIPDMMVSIVSSEIARDVDTIACHLSTNYSPTPRRLVRGAFSDFMRAERFRVIAGVTMGNGATYYGLPGVIFDSQFNILFMMTATLKLDENNRLVLLGHNCRISPSVFQHQEGVIEKTIVKKIIPYCTSHIVGEQDFPYIFFESIVRNKPIRVVIDDVSSDFIHSVVPPKISECTPQVIHDILNHNMSQLLAE